MKHILTVLLPTFAVMTAMTLIVLLRTHALDGLRSTIQKRLPRIAEQIPQIIEEALE